MLHLSATGSFHDQIEKEKKTSWATVKEMSRDIKAKR